MRFDILTLFPEAFESPMSVSIVGAARESGLVSIHLHQLRDWTEDRHHTADDTPYGGGGGMVMKPEPVVKAVRAVKSESEELAAAPVIYMSPQGEVLTTAIADELAKLSAVILLCGSYEGIDERAIEAVVDREISIGDYVLTGGELAAMVLVNAVVRKLPGVVKNIASVERDSFEDGLLDFPHYTRPEVFEGKRVPEVLLSGHHAKVEEWRRREALKRTLLRRPDLLENATLSDKDRKLLDSIRKEL